MKLLSGPMQTVALSDAAAMLAYLNLREEFISSHQSIKYARCSLIRSV